MKLLILGERIRSSGMAATKGRSTAPVTKEAARERAAKVRERKAAKEQRQPNKASKSR